LKAVFVQLIALARDLALLLRGHALHIADVQKATSHLKFQNTLVELDNGDFNFDVNLGLGRLSAAMYPCIAIKAVLLYSGCKAAGNIKRMA
jgi:hypothetical protein